MNENIKKERRTRAAKKLKSNPDEAPALNTNEASKTEEDEE
jgi:hypothetical protein